MRRHFLSLALLAIFCAACSADTGSSASSAGGVTETTTAQEITTGPEVDGTTSTTDAIEATETTSGLPLAPDFTLQLGEGGSYTLSEGAKPVYLVFWAEW